MGTGSGRTFRSIQKESAARRKAYDPFDEATQGRLATLCVYVLKIAMHFEAAIICRTDYWMPKSPRLVFHLDTLQLAIAHVEGCFKSAQSLADVANKNVIREQAETLLAAIRGDFSVHPKDPGSIVTTRTQLTRTYAHNPKRRGGFTVDHLYGRIIPSLIACGDAILLTKEHKKERYAFRVET